MCILSKWSDDMKDRIIQRGYFGIEARDALTNLPVPSEEIKIFVNGRTPVLKKEGRYHIFRLTDSELLKVQIESLAYEKKSCVVSKFAGEIQMMPDGMMYPFCGTFLFLIFLYPGENYTLPAGYHRAIVSGQPGEAVRVIKNQGKWYYLTQEYHGGDWIDIFMPEEHEARGRYFRIQEREGMPYEDFAIVGEKERVGYRMKEALRGNYPKGSRIYELYLKMADGEGMAEVILAGGNL